MNRAFKYRLIRLVDVSGLNFLAPLVRLCFADEPSRQLSEIGRLIFVPLAAFAAFLLVWTALAPRHRTKSGEVPTPAAVWTAAQNIWTMHRREEDKKDAFFLAGAAREEKLEQVKARLAELAPYEERAQQMVTQAEEERKRKVQNRLAPLEDRRRALELEASDMENKSSERLQTLAASIASDDLQGKERYLAEVRMHLAQADQRRLHLVALNNEIARAREEKFAPLDKARRIQSKIADEKQYLLALADQLSFVNRSVKLQAEADQLRSHERNLLTASGEEVASLATDVVRSESRLKVIAESSYAKPWTLPMQVCRSVACVFAGFAMGSVLAIPLGVLCGLSRTFMAAMTPFIALFKPVSPIVWLPIALIMVGGIITDPDENWLMAGLADVPLIGWMKINSAFIASAITVALCSLWATIVNTALGVASVDKDHLNVARVLRLGFWSRLIKIVIPSALPLMFTGLRISLGVGWMVLIAGELLSASEGIGKFVWDQFNNGASDSFAKMIVVVFIVGIIGLVLDRIMVMLQRLVSFDGEGAVV